MNPTEIEELLAESLLPSTMALLAPSRKPLGVKALHRLAERGFKVESIKGSSTGVITFEDGRRGFVFIKLNPAVRKRVPHWYPTKETGT